MVNPLLDDFTRITGSSSSGGVGVNVDVTSTSTESFEVIDESDSYHGIVLAVSRADGVDINADTMSLTPLSTQIPLLITDSNNSTIYRVN